jgi:predicted MFS family arabinose efflux permease
MPIGMTLVLLAAPLLVPLGWRGFWLLNAGVLVGYAALLGLGLRPIPVTAAAARNLTEDVRDILASRAPWILAGLFTAFSAAFFAVFGFLPQLLADRLAAVGPETGNLLTGVAVAMSAVGNLLGGLLLTRGVRRPFILIGGFAAMALCTFGILGEGIPGGTTYALCLLFSAISGLIPVTLLDAAGRYAPRPDLVGATIGFMMQGNSAGLVLAPAAAGAIAAAAGWPAVALLVATIAAIAALLVAVLRAMPAGATGRT